MRVPIVFKPSLEAIAQWADSTENPTESLNKLLAYAESIAEGIAQWADSTENPTESLNKLLAYAESIAEGIAHQLDKQPN